MYACHMIATGHLELLRQMFPDKLVLDVTEVAMVLGCPKKRLYTLSSKKELPFATLPGFRIQVTMMELARYLDASGSVAVDDDVSHEMVKSGARTDVVEPPAVKRKKGRPRKIDRILKK